MDGDLMGISISTTDDAFDLDLQTPQTVAQISNQPPDFQWKLWLYTNYDCHLRCTYCVAESSPKAPRRALRLENVRRLVDEAQKLGFQEVFLTGGEPFVLDEIYDMLAYAAPRLKTTVLTTGMLLKGSRLERLERVAHQNLTLQVSLDGGQPEHHDAYRGWGAWAKTVDAIQRLLAHGFHVRLSTTETPANSAHLDEICALHTSLGIPESDHFIRPLARRGFSQEGMQVSMTNLTPEITVNADGVFWHPLSTDADMQVSKQIFPLADAVACVQEQMAIIAAGGQPTLSFT